MTDNLMGDFIKAQAEMSNAELNKINPHFKSKYADLSAVRTATLPALNKFGLGIIQIPTIKEDGKFVLISKIVHKSGEIIQQCEYPLSSGIPPQKMGSEITYARRYTWSSLCGICADDDDDGNGAEKKEPVNGPQTVQSFWKGPLNKTALKQALRDLSGEINKISVKDTPEFLDGIWADHNAVLDQAMVDLPEWYDGAIKAKAKAIEIINSFPGDTPFDEPAQAPDTYGDGTDY